MRARTDASSSSGVCFVEGIAEDVARRFADEEGGGL